MAALGVVIGVGALALLGYIVYRMVDRDDGPSGPSGGGTIPRDDDDARPGPDTGFQ